MGRDGLTTRLAVVAVFGVVIRLGARWGVDTGFLRGFCGWEILGTSGYLDLVGLPNENSLLRKPRFFSVSFSPRYTQMGSACGRSYYCGWGVHTTAGWPGLIFDGRGG